MTRIFKRDALGDRSIVPIVKTLIVPASSGLSSMLTMVILLIASRRGEFDGVASYATGVAAGALIAALLSGGTTLAFVNGGPRTRVAVIRLRLRLVAPALLLGGSIAAFAYSVFSEFTLLGVLAGVASVCFNNLAELESSRLKSNLRTGTVLCVMVTSRAIGVLLVVDFSYGLSMFMASALSFLGLLIASRLLTSEEIVKRGTFVENVRLAYSPFYVAVAILDAAVTRSPYLFVGLQVFASGIAPVSALMSAQQGISALLIAAVFTTMSVRGRTGNSSAWMNKIDRMTVGFSVVVGLTGAVFGDFFAGLIGVTGTQSGTWMGLLSLAIIPYVLNRVNQYRDHTRDLRRRIVLRLAVTAVVCLGMLFWATLTGESTILVASWLIAETAAFLVVPICEKVRRARVRRR